MNRSYDDGEGSLTINTTCQNVEERTDPTGSWIASGCCPGLIQWPDVSINLMEKVVE